MIIQKTPLFEMVNATEFWILVTFAIIGLGLTLAWICRETDKINPRGRSRRVVTPKWRRTR